MWYIENENKSIEEQLIGFKCLHNTKHERIVFSSRSDNISLLIKISRLVENYSIVTEFSSKCTFSDSMIASLPQADQIGSDALAFDRPVGRAKLHFTR